MLQRINGLRIADHDLPVPDFMWHVPRDVLNASQLLSCLLPFTRGPVPGPLLEVGLCCVTDHLSR
jgi:hypothetical protein